MGQPAARITDMHVCPMFNGPVPHVGGPILKPASPTVLIGGLPAAGIGSAATCVGPPDTIVMGSSGVLIGGVPAARLGDTCSHGGTVVAGCPTVLIGANMPGPPVVVVPPMVMSTSSSVSSKSAKAIEDNISNGTLKGENGKVNAQMLTLISASEKGTPFCEKCEQAKKKIEELQKQQSGSSSGGSGGSTQSGSGSYYGSGPEEEEEMQM